MARQRPMTAEERAADRKADKLIKARQWQRYHENEARILGTYLRREPDYFPKEVERLTRGIAQLQEELKNTLERMANCTPELLKEHETKAREFARQVAMIENEDKIASLTALAAKINASLPAGMTIEQAVAMMTKGGAE